VPTNYTYQDGLVTSVTKNSLQTLFTYDNGELATVRYPQGNYEVFCHRVSTGACDSTKPWTKQVQSRAKTSDPTAATWSEKISYAYRADGNLMSETYLGPSGEVRKKVLYDFDGHSRPTWMQTGTSGPVTTAAYDRNSNLAGVGPAYNTSGKLLQVSVKAGCRR